MQYSALFTSAQALTSSHHPISELRQGEPDTFGLIACTKDLADPPPDDTDYLFFEWNINTMTMIEKKIRLPYRTQGYLALEYDHVRHLWIIVCSALITENPQMYATQVSDIYEIDPRNNYTLHLIMRLKRASETDYEKSPLLLWQRKTTLSLLFHKHYEEGCLTRSTIYLTQWGSTKEQHEHKLVHDFISLPFIFAEGFLILSCDFSKRSSRWKIKLTAFQNDGTRLASKWLPHIAFPNGHKPLFVGDDLDSWLQPIIFASNGPGTGEDAQPTCAALVSLRDHPVRQNLYHKYRPQHNLPLTQGGLYWIDQQGHILQYDNSPIGEEVQFCCCGTSIIGTYLWHGQRRLWSWSPQQQKEKKIVQLLSNTSQRVTIVSQTYEEHTKPQFWCIEEQADNLHISLWVINPLQLLQETFIAQITLLGSHASYIGGVKDVLRPHSITTYHASLLIAVLTPENRLQLIRITSDHTE